MQKNVKKLIQYGYYLKISLYIRYDKTNISKTDAECRSINFDLIKIIQPLLRSLFSTLVDFNYKDILYTFLNFRHATLKRHILKGYKKLTFYQVSIILNKTFEDVA